MQIGDNGRLASLDAAVRAFGEAWARGDTDAAKELLSPSYSHNDLFGKQWTYSECLAYFDSRKGRATRITFRDVRTRHFGDLAIITGFNDVTGEGVTAESDTQDLTLLFLQIWRWDHGRWLREAFQATPVVSTVIG